jgi:DNA invertase Pin-like site-specific DNA recombinase
MTEKVAIYARVSTLDKGQDVNLQLNDLRTYSTARGWKVYREYIDNGQSGTNEQRPALSQLMEDARKRKIDIVLVWRLDRFGRSLKHLIVSLDELKTLGVGFVSFKESLDFTTAAGRLMFHLLGAFSEFERELIRERVVAGIQNSKSKGKRIGRPSLINPTLESKITDMRNRGMSYSTIGNTLNLSKSTVYKTFQNSTRKTP